MNLTRWFLILILFLVFNAGANSQEPPKAILVDEIGKTSCGDLAARLDWFIQESGKTNTSIGYILISDDSIPQGKSREKFIDGYPRFRGATEDRIEVFRAKLDPPTHTQMWIVPIGVKFTIQPLPDEDYAITESKRKFPFYEDSRQIGACYTGPPFRLFARYLRVNPNYSANIAIGTVQNNTFLKLIIKVSALFKKSYGIDPRRLKFFRTKTEFDPPIYDLWLVRRKSN